MFVEDEVKVMIEESEARQHLLLAGLNSGLTNTANMQLRSALPLQRTGRKIELWLVEKRIAIHNSSINTD